MMSVVYVVQEPLMRDRVTGKTKPKFDLAPAQKFGEIRYLLGWSDDVSDVQSLVWFLRDKLKDFSDEDYLMMTGDPNAMAISAAVASEINNGRVKILSWDNLARDYLVFPMDMNVQPIERENYAS